MTIDYLQKIRESKSLESLATYVRAFGQSVSGGLFVSYRNNPAALEDAVMAYEYHARAVESCRSVNEGKKYLRKLGYGC